MKIRLWKYIVPALLLLPESAYADMDIITKLGDLSRNLEKDGVVKLVKENFEFLQKTSTNFVNMDYSKFNPMQLKDMGLKTFTAATSGWNFSDKSPPSLAATFHGGSNGSLRELAQKEFMVGRRSGDDVEKVKRRDDKVNELMIGNVSLMYARGLVRRYQLDNEKNEEFNDYNNINAVQAVYVDTLHKGDSRWISMIQSEASLMAQSATKQISAIRPEEEEEEPQDAQAAGQNQNTNTQASAGAAPKSEKKKYFNITGKAQNWLGGQAGKAGDWLGNQSGKAVDKYYDKKINKAEQKKNASGSGGSGQ